MRCAIEEDRLHTDHRVTGEHADLQRVLDSVVDRRDVFAWHATTGDLVLELVDLVSGHLHRLERDLDLGELARTTGLLLVGVVVFFDHATDRLAVGDLWLADIRLYAELTLHPVDQDVEVKLAHSLDDGLPGVLVLLSAEGRVLLSELLDRETQLLLVGLGLRLDGDLDDRLGEGHRLENDLIVRIGQRVAGRRVLEADDRVDVASRDAVDRVLLVGVHLEDLADALLLALGRVDQLRAGVGVTGVHADVGQTTEERVNGNLERESREGFLRVRVTLDDLLFVTHVVTLCRRHVERARQVVDDGVQHRLHTAVLECGTAEHWIDLARDGQLADRLLDLGDREVGVAVEEALEQLVVGLSDHLEKRCAVLVRLVDEVGRDRLDVVLGTQLDVTLRVPAPGERTHLDQVDDTLEGVLEADWELDDQGLRAEALDDGLDREVEVSAELVHLVDEADARNVVLVGLAPDGLGLGLDALLAIEDGNGAVENAERTLHLDGEVHVTGGIDDVDLVLVPETGRRRRRDRDAAFLLLRHPVHRGCTIVHLTDLVGDAGVVQDALGGSGLASIDVSHDADVADLVQVGEHVLCHGCPPKELNK